MYFLCFDVVDLLLSARTIISSHLNTFSSSHFLHFSPRPTSKTSFFLMYISSILHFIVCVSVCVSVHVCACESVSFVFKLYIYRRFRCVRSLEYHKRLETLIFRSYTSKIILDTHTHTYIRCHSLMSVVERATTMMGQSVSKHKIEIKTK